MTWNYMKGHEMTWCDVTSRDLTWNSCDVILHSFHSFPYQRLCPSDGYSVLPSQTLLPNSASRLSPPLIDLPLPLLTLFQFSFFYFLETISRLCYLSIIVHYLCRLSVSRQRLLFPFGVVIGSNVVASSTPAAPFRLSIPSPLLPLLPLSPLSPLTFPRTHSRPTSGPCYFQMRPRISIIVGPSVNPFVGLSVGPSVSFREVVN